MEDLIFWMRVPPQGLHSFNSMRIFWENLPKSYVGTPPPPNGSAPPRIIPGSATVLAYICSFQLYLQNVMLVNVKLDVSRYKAIAFQDCRLHFF